MNKKSLAEAKREKGHKENPLYKNFYKLYSDHRTKDYMQDEHFEKLVKDALSDSNLLMNLLDNDIRFHETFSVLTGLDKKFILQEMDKHKKEKEIFIKKMENEAITFQKKHSEELKKKEFDIEYEKMSPDQKKKIDNQKEAEELKHKGNEEQKKHNYDIAIKCFEQALKLSPNDLGTNLNLASAFLEKKDYENCMKQCEHVLQNTDDIMKRSRAHGKLGLAYLELKDYIKAIENFHCSLDEHRDDRIVEALIEAENERKKWDEEKYINPEIAEQNNKKAYDLYKAGKIEEALSEYTEAIRRNPYNARFWCNRAEGYMKVLSYNEAIKDCEKCIELDKEFMRAYLRKATCHLLLKQFPLALETYEKGLEINPSNMELVEGKKKCLDLVGSELKELDNQKLKEAPEEIKNLILDPRIKQLLDLFKTNVTAAHEMMKIDKFLQDSFNKLVKNGLISGMSTK